MTVYIPPGELERLEALRRYSILDTSPEPAFDRITNLASELLQVPMSAIAFVDRDRTWFKSGRGLEIRELGREAFAEYSIAQEEPFALADAREDPRFASSPLVAGPLAVRACAGAPLKTPEGFRIGVLCAMDRTARQFRPGDLLLLAHLADLAVDCLDLRRKALSTADTVPQQSQKPDLRAAAFASAAVGVNILDKDGILVDVNQTYCRMTGYSREELVGNHFTMVVPAELQGLAASAHKTFLEGGNLDPTEWRIRCKDGVILDVHLTAALMISGNGCRFRVNTITDVSALKRLEAQLSGTEKMEAVSRLAGGAAHGFNNLLTIITGYSQMLRNTLSDTDPACVYADEISKAADRAALLTGKLLAFSRRRFGQPERLDINALVAKTVSAASAQLSAGTTLSTDLAPDLPPVLADRAYVVQALSDLIANAREAMPEGGSIMIRTSGMEIAESRPPLALRPGRYVLVAIADTGVGIDPETRRHLFEPFFTTKGIGKGTGLATVYGTVKQLGGDVAVSSLPGSGTTVSLYLPAAT
jgi:two-component system cell cycle sensor histidine kinase/response regulator CckA